MAHLLGGTVQQSDAREYGNTMVHVETDSPVFFGAQQENICWMSHTDYISKVPEGFRVIAQTEAVR